MTPGTWYVAEHIFTCLLAALVLGGILGYLIHWFSSKSLAANLEGEWARKLGLVNDERSNLAVQLKAAEGSVTDWKTKFAGLDGDHKTLTAKFADLTGKIPALEAAIAGWVAKSAVWDSDRAKLQMDLKACAEARGKLETEVADWVTKGKAWDTQRASLDAEWNNKLIAANDGRAKLQASLTALQDDHAKIKTSFADVQGKIAPLEGVVAGWVAKSALWDGDKSKLQADLKSATDVRSKLEMEVTELSARLSSTDAQLKKAIADDKADDSAYEKTIADLRMRLSALDAEKTRAQAGVADLTARLNSAQAQLQKAIADDKADDSAYEKTIAELHAKLATADTTHHQWVLRVKETEAHVHEWQQRFNALEAEHGKTKHHFAEVSSKLGPLEGAIAGWVAKSALWDSDRAKLQVEIRDLTARLHSTDAQLKKAIDDDKARDLESAATYEKTIADLRGRITAMTSAVDDWTARGRTWEAREADYNSKLQAAAGLQASGAVQERTITDLRARVAMLEQDWRARYTSLETEHAQCVTRYAVLESKLAAAPMAMAATATSSGTAGMANKTGGDIEDIEGIGPVYGGKLRGIGIYWIHELLEAGKDPEGRARIVEGTGIEKHLVLKWVNHADLLRVSGVTPNWAELLEASGVDTVKELRNRVPANLQKKMEETNPTNGNGRYAPTVPDLETVTRWVEQAKTMTPKLTY